MSAPSRRSATRLEEFIAAEAGPPFLGAPRMPADAALLRDHGARAAVLGIPYDQSSFLRSRGTAHGPKAIREASASQFSWFLDFEVDLLDTFHLVDCGDVPIVPGNATRSRSLITGHVGEILDAGAVPICLGGDHSIPIPILDAFEPRFEGRMGYLHLDAHLDAQPEDVDGERSTSWHHVTRAAERANVDPRNVALVGIRGGWNSPEELHHVRERGMRLFTMREIDRRGIDASIESALDAVMDGTHGFYLTWDVDVIDVSAMPGCDAPEPGGLTPREALRAAELIGAQRPIGIDIAELTPAFDGPSHPSSRLACNVLFYLLGSWATSPAG